TPTPPRPRATTARQLAALPRDTGGASALAYRLVLLQHLAGTEAMITSFRSTARSRNGAAEQRIALWARDLLTTTRMLESSAAADDPTMKHLLDDLDLVLTQITRYTTSGR